ncbi:MAG: 3' terminal RNA ribose 2'-O-methyltransferase Hen1 [Planctomycetota bacterium]|nr:MAG: 3' terminal RNA ribose 2'-O-methyltransferase Hen1 [Planctomycetota bacterium]REJ86932.1 MAG: 3' terminal RNA ribose 2'-O-methyltransferase Hen1 [Planctomycetota bacterium]REK24941.1 MAG: 3' terminal RNA ribose 2'-O-methyltransferase Hen1 [Planctomycetota bacterium]REK48530.1 MAG: 3' terminal RNA ribose 2'-O-methyltransferase Hen1 [Planctomycetota bacterium]
MLLTISTNHEPATDLGYLLHKHPDRHQTFDLSFGRAHVFYPEADTDRCSACLLLDVDPVGLVRGKGNWKDGLLDQYVNDRPYVASSLMSVAISQVFGSALAGRSRERAELVETPIPLTARIDVLPVRGGEDLLHRVFDPLGYSVSATQHPLDEKFEDWGESPYYSVELEQATTVAQLLQHLYVLIPVFDQRKHYYVGPDEVEKLLAKGESWLADHPERGLITRRYLKKRQSLVRQALARLVEEDVSNADEDQEVDDLAAPEEKQRELSLHEQRLGAVLAAIRASGAKRVVDLGCGEGKLLRELLADHQFTEILGMDVSVRSLEIAHRRLKLDRLPDMQRQRITLMHGALTYRDERLANFDAAAVVEVIEHLDPPRLIAFERVVFEHARPRTVVLTTPNREYNVMWESLPAGKVRHSDHRFEWTREEFQSWANRIAERFNYIVRFLPVGPEEAEVGAPSQMGMFEAE